MAAKLWVAAELVIAEGLLLRSWPAHSKMADQSHTNERAQAVGMAWWTSRERTLVTSSSMAVVNVCMPPMAVPMSTPHRCGSSCFARASGSRLMPASSSACALSQACESCGGCCVVGRPLNAAAEAGLRRVLCSACAHGSQGDTAWLVVARLHDTAKCHMLLKRLQLCHSCLLPHIGACTFLPATMMYLMVLSMRRSILRGT